MEPYSHMGLIAYKVLFYKPSRFPGVGRAISSLVKYLITALKRIKASLFINVMI